MCVQRGSRPAAGNPGALQLDRLKGRGEEISAFLEDPAQAQAVIDEQLADPDLAQLPEDERMELVSEVLDEIRAS